MKNPKKSLIFLTLLTLVFFGGTSVYAAPVDTPNPSLQVNLPFFIPNLGEILTFAIRTFFAVAALVALVYLILGAFAWITSGGDKEAVKKAQDKITNALLGLIIIVVVLAVAITLEQVVFNKTICFGLTCPVTIPTLLKPNPNQVPQTDNTLQEPNDPNAGLPGTGEKGSVGGASDQQSQ